LSAIGKNIEQPSHKDTKISHAVSGLEQISLNLKEDVILSMSRNAVSIRLDG